MEKSTLNQLICLFILLFSLNLRGQDEPKINKDLVQEGIEEPDHPTQDLKTYTTDDIIDFTQRDAVNNEIIRPYLHPETDNKDDIGISLDYTGTFYFEDKVLANIRFKSLPETGTLKLRHGIDKTLVSTYHLGKVPCLERYFVLPKLNSKYTVSYSPLDSDKEYFIKTFETDYVQKDVTFISKQGQEYFGNYFSKEKEIPYSQKLAEYEHPFEAMAIAQQHFKDVYPMDVYDYLLSKNAGNNPQPPLGKEYSKNKLDSIYEIWDEFNKAVRAQFGQDLSKLSEKDCDSLRAWVKRISMKYLVLYIYKVKRKGVLYPRGDECNCITMATEINNADIRMPNYTSNLSKDYQWYHHKIFPQHNDATNPTSYFNEIHFKSWVDIPKIPDHYPKPFGGAFPWQFNTDFDGKQIVDLDGDGDNWAQYGGAITGGPGFNNMRMEHHGSCTYPINYKFRSGGNNLSPNSVRFGIMYACVDWIPELPKNCGCDLDVNLQYYYTSQLATQVMSVDNCWLHGTHAFARADNLAYVYVEDMNSGLKSVLAAGGATDSSIIKNSYTSDFWKGIGGIGGAAVAVATNPVAGTITTFGKAIFDFLGNNGIKRFYGGGRQVNFDALIDGHRRISIPENTPKEIVLGGAMNLETNGEDGFYTYAQLNSNFSFSWFVRKNQYDKLNPGCCRPAFGAYYKYGGSNHTNAVNGHFHLSNYPGYKVPILTDINNYGSFESPYDCNDGYYNDFLKSAGTKKNNDWFRIDANKLKWNIADSELYNLEIFELSGKLISSLRIIPVKDETLIDLAKLTNNLYLVRVSKGEDYQTIKLDLNHR